MKFSLPKIYPITDRQISGLSHAGQVERLIEGGARLIQLREKRASSLEFYEQAEKALKIARRFRVRILINDRVDIALTLRADGVHLGQDDLPPEEARRILGPDAIIGFSTHSVEQAIKAVEMPIDYLAVGPVFPTRTKEDPDETVGLEGVRSVRRSVGDFPLVAIGGITWQNFPQVLRNGADSAAVISGILSPPEKIPENLRKFLN
ncbi:MAG: thiamine phosphate synthase [Pyrinomonadaceae bacterium]